MVLALRIYLEHTVQGSGAHMTGVDMVVLWVVSAVGLFIIAPLVILLATNVIRPALESARYADDILEHGVGITVGVESVPALVVTRERVGDVTQNAVAYVGALRRLVAASTSSGTSAR